MKMINKLIEYHVKKEKCFWMNIADNCTDDESTNKIYKCLKFQIIQLILFLPLISILNYIAITVLDIIIIFTVSIANITYIIWVFSTFNILKYYIELSFITGKYKAIKELAEEEESNKHV